MKLLLDTHIFIWWVDEPEKLSASAVQALEEGHNRLLLSLVSIWEIQIKIQLGKIKLSLPLRNLIDDQEKANEMEVMPITKDHLFALDSLPFHHKDPFDRLLIAQSIVENITIVSADPKFSDYPVALVR